MHSQTRCDDSRAPVLIPASDVGNPRPESHGRHRQNATVWIDLPDDEFGAVS